MQYVHLKFVCRKFASQTHTAVRSFDLCVRLQFDVPSKFHAIKKLIFAVFVDRTFMNRHDRLSRGYSDVHVSFWCVTLGFSLSRCCGKRSHRCNAFDVEFNFNANSLKSGASKVHLIFHACTDCNVCRCTCFRMEGVHVHVRYMFITTYTKDIQVQTIR